MNEKIHIPVYYTQCDENYYFYNFENIWLSNFVEKILTKKLYEYFELIFKNKLKENEQITYTQQSTINELVEIIWELFESSGGKVCGGFFSTLFLSKNKIFTKTDIDVFFDPDSLSKIQNIEKIIQSHIEKDNIHLKQTENAYSFILGKTFNKDIYNSTNGTVKISSIQLIKPTVCSGYTVKDIIKTFDFTVCQFGYDIKNKIFTQAKCFDEHIQQKKLYISPFFNGTISKKRIDKYIQVKKFSISIK